MKKIITILMLLAFLGLSNLANACSPFTPTIYGQTQICWSANSILNVDSYTAYLWSTGETTNSITVVAGIYSVTVTDNMGCTGTNSITITEVSFSPLIGTLTDLTYIGIGDTAIFYAYNIPGHCTFAWNYDTAHTDTIHSIINGRGPTNYQVYVTDSLGCQIAGGTNFVVQDVNARFSLYPDTNQLHHYFLLCQFINNNPPYTAYDWNWGDGSQHDTIAAPTHTYANAGVYNICLYLTDSNPYGGGYCIDSFNIQRMSNAIGSVTVINPFATGINEINSINTLTISPNPTANTITIHQNNYSPNQQVMITDVLGNKVYSHAINTATETIDISHLSSGIYFYEVSGKRGKIIKQ
ncbi:MAG: T9SS type A sorting domain-containing protein [Bacteroidota bacterium]